MKSHELSLINLENQANSLGLGEVKFGFDGEVDCCSAFGTGIKIVETGTYCPEFTRFYGGRAIESVPDSVLVSAFAVARHQVSNEFFVRYLAEECTAEETGFVYLPQKEKTIELSDQTWYVQENRSRALSVEIPGEYVTVVVGSHWCYFFKPNSSYRVEITKELVWGCQVDDDWNCYSNWISDPDINPEFSEIEDGVHHYAKQDYVWSAKVHPIT